MRNPHPRNALITGIGLVSSLGEGMPAHRAALAAGQPVLDRASFAPWAVHPLATPDYDRMLPKRDQRQMEPWQRIGTYAAGLALESAGIRGDAELLGRTHMLVAAGGGERDYAVDAAVLTGMPKAVNPAAYLNEHLMSDLRPTLFLAQLSNLLAGNISIVHGVVGSSRTLMGEEAAGADAVRIACARIAAGQGDLFLVGGSYNAQRVDTVLQYEMGGVLWKHPFTGVWSRAAEGGGMVMGSLGCFLVIESRAHAEARGAPAQAHIAAVATDRCRRLPGEASANAKRQLGAFGVLDGAAVVSGASGVAAATAEEAAFLAATGLPVRATASLLGHSMEPSFIANLAIAADVVAQGRLFPPLDAGEAEMQDAVRQVVVTGWGHWRGESMALVEAAS
jgi:3-oxoacyl-[acyl-carrier-protein] synthase II